MSEEPDGVDEAFEAALRVGLTAAGRVAERVARDREAAARAGQASREQEARELQGRLDAERSAARALLAPAEQADWWQSASPEQVATVWQHALAWQTIDPDAQRTADRVRREVRERYGVDVDEPRADPAALAAAIAERDGAERDAQQQRAQGRQEDTEAVLLLRSADRADAGRPGPGGAGEQDAGVLYDSAERRRALAASLEGIADAETVQARVLADTSQARPAEQAVAGPARPAAGARRSRGPAGRVKQHTPVVQR